MIRSSNRSEYFQVLLKISVSPPSMPVAAQAFARDGGEMSLPATPPARLADVVRTGLIPICMAVTCCNFPNRTAEEVTEPVRKTPSHPMTGENTGKALPV